MENQVVVRYREEDPDKPDRWMVMEPIRYQTAIGEVTIPRGYVTDFASVPVWLWGLFPPIGRHNRASLLHDFWYDNRLGENDFGMENARLLADREFWFRLNEAEPNRKFRNRLMYLACRWFGRQWWVE
ncbi:DUF1353 domain-containing protein [Larkinella sp. C7]|uniref:DUF1353 domain-containing protein n=1 Tax=Larkinella sp. C7 TaxID=2576607 RepID=UPI0014866584|nr:DUF1353 domain-containing protein [Larkinella sp. C7]